MINNQIKKQIVSQLLNFIDRNKHKGIKTVFQAEKIGEKLGADIKNLLIKAVYGTINRIELKNGLENIIQSENLQYFYDNGRPQLTLLEKEINDNTEFNQKEEPVEIQPSDRLKTGPEKKANPTKEFFKTVMEGLGPRLPSPTGIVEAAPYTAHAIQAVKNRNQVEYLRWAELYGYGEQNPYYDKVTPEFREKAKKGLVK